MSGDDKIDDEHNWCLWTALLGVDVVNSNNGRRVRFYSVMVCRVVVFLFFILLVYVGRRWTIYVRV